MDLTLDHGSIPPNLHAHAGHRFCCQPGPGHVFLSDSLLAPVAPCRLSSSSHDSEETSEMSSARALMELNNQQHLVRVTFGKQVRSRMMRRVCQPPARTSGQDRRATGRQQNAKGKLPARGPATHARGRSRESGKRPSRHKMRS